MKLTVLKDNLKEAISAVERVVSDQSQLPILKNILIVADQNKIKIVGTNLEIGITRYALGKIHEDGGITVPFHTFASIVHNCDSERMQLETEGTTLHVKTDNYHAKLQGIARDEFPIIPAIERTKESLQIASGILKNAITEIITAAQISEIRPEISGILFDAQQSQIKIVATDSFRLGEKTIHHTQFSTSFTQGIRIIIPLKTVQEIVRIFPDDKELSLFVDPHQLLVKTNDIELISRLIDGQYPDYEQIVPKSLETQVILPKDHFVNAVKLVSTFSGKVNDIKVRLHETGSALEIYSAHQQLGENAYLVPAKVKGEFPKEVTFNWRYLQDGLKPIASKEFLLGLNGDTKPALLKSQEETTYFYIVMPIKV